MTEIFTWALIGAGGTFVGMAIGVYAVYRLAKYAGPKF